MTKATSSLVGLDGKNLTYPTSKEIEEYGRQSFTNMDAVTISQMLGNLDMPMRSRAEIYQTYGYMINDPIMYSALKLHVTQSLGGHETTGEVVFLDKKPDIDKASAKIVDEIQASLMNIINEVAYNVCFNAVGYGDAYARIYSQKGKGIIHLATDDFYLPPLVHPFERGGVTVGYQLSVDNKELVPLNARQMARMKMPRMSFIPQARIQYNHWKQSVAEDDLSKVMPLPCTIGGSFCEAAEKPFFLMQSALTGLSSSRILDSIRETMLGLNLTDMTEAQQKEFVNQIGTMLRKSKEKAANAIKSRQPVIENIFHLIPTWREKQLYTIDAGGAKNQSSANSYTVDDVMFYAKLLAGALGLDLSLLGFSELLSGGLGDGGFFRVSAQSGAASRMIRQGFTGFINHLIDVHCEAKYGGVFEDGKRPYEITFIGATSALERENQETRERKVNASSMVISVLMQLKELGAGQEEAIHFMTEQMGFDDNDAKVYARLVMQSEDEAVEEDV